MRTFTALVCCSCSCSCGCLLWQVYAVVPFRLSASKLISCNCVGVRTSADCVAFSLCLSLSLFVCAGHLLQFVVINLCVFITIFMHVNCVMRLELITRQAQNQHECCQLCGCKAQAKKRKTTTINKSEKRKTRKR